MTTNVHCFLPDISRAQLAGSESGQALNEWQSVDSQSSPIEQFSRLLGFKQAEPDWTMVRLSAFDGIGKPAFACCVDPVLVHTTHRGVYLLGQQGLTLNRQQALEIVATINESLMDDGEQLLLLDEKRWLFISDKESRLDSPDWRELAGKDLFKFHNDGKGTSRWQKLANEMQMLIHQLADYKNLIEIPPQYMVSVHFWNGVNPQQAEPIEFARGDSRLYCDDPEIQQFCCQAVIEQQELNELLKPEIDWPVNAPGLIWFGQDEVEQACKILPRLIRDAENNQMTLYVHLADQTLGQQSIGWMNKVKQWFSGSGF